MPQRFLRPGLTNSPRWNRVSFKAQSFYVRLLTLVDDYGRFDGRHSILHSQCFTIWNELNPHDPVNLADVPGLCGELQTHELCDFYEAEGKKVVQITQWRERIRDGVAKRFPDKVAATCSNLQQVPAPPAQSCCKLQASSPSSSPSSSPTPASPPSPSAPAAPAASVLALVTKTVEAIKEKDLLDVRQRMEADLNAEYQRPASQSWSYEEQCLLVEISRRPDVLRELGVILQYKRRLPFSERRFFPQSIARVLFRWDEMLDRARGAGVKPPVVVSRPPPPITGKKFERSDDLARKFREGAQASIKANV